MQAFNPSRGRQRSTELVPDSQGYTHKNPVSKHKPKNIRQSKADNLIMSLLTRRGYKKVCFFSSDLLLKIKYHANYLENQAVQ